MSPIGAIPPERLGTDWMIIPLNELDGVAMSVYRAGCTLNICGQLPTHPTSPTPHPAAHTPYLWDVLKTPVYSVQPGTTHLTVHY